MAELRFDDKVAIVTGAGNGLGKAHALLLASRGAKVVINDLGGGIHGDGSSARVADVVVEEIAKAGGEAVANYDSVEEGDKIVQTALDTYGRVDIIVNNAGILRDVSFHKMSQEDWDLIYRVHVLGSYKVTAAAWPHMREQRYGRIIMTASAAGIYGNFGQANYSMAKLGLAGFANTLALEGRNRGVHVNTIAPLAGSRLTETVLPPELIDALKPEFVSPLVAWLCHEDCEETGGLFEVGGGFFGKLRWERAAGKLFRIGRDISPEAVKGAWGVIAGFEKSTHPSDIASSMQPIMGNIQAGPSKGGNEFIDVDEALGYQFPTSESSYDERDLALYALGVGAGGDPYDDKELQLVYEMHGSGFKALPTYAVIPAVNQILTMAKEGHQAPGLNFGLDRLLHGEQYTELYRPLPASARLTHESKVKDIWDKGKHAVVVYETISRDETGEPLMRNELTAVIRGAGGWGGDRGPADPGNEPPNRKPDATVTEKIDESQALLYRLSGDWNPLHVDPAFAKAFGFEKPILHGLCTFGFAGRHVISKFSADADPRYFKNIKVRFADSVFPGETLITEMWKESDRKIIFRCKVAERDAVVISNAAIELYDEIPKPVAKPAAKAAGAAVSAVPISRDIFAAMGQFVSGNDEVGTIGKVYQFVLTDPNSVWTLDLKKGEVVEGESARPDCTLELTDSDFMDMCTGKADPQKLYFGGKLKISGDVMASQKLTFLSKIDPQLVLDAARARAGADSGSGGDAPAAVASDEPGSWDVFVAIRDHIERNPDLTKIGKVYQFRLTDPESVWTVDVKNGGVGEGETVKPDCTLELTDSDFMGMTRGELDPQKLYFGGKLKISGDVMASQKLTFLQKIDPEQAIEAVKRARAEKAAGGGAKAAAAPAPRAEVVAPKVFEKLQERLGSNPGLADEVAAKMQFVVTNPDAFWVVDLTRAPGEVKSGTNGKAAVTLTLADDALKSLVSGEASAQDLYQRGALRIDGDIRIAQRLAFLNGLLK